MKKKLDHFFLVLIKIICQKEKMNLVQLLDDFKISERPTWDELFMTQAIVSSKRSPSPKLQVGSVIVCDSRIVCTGYNGFLPGLEHESIEINQHEVNTVHAEQNAIAQAAKRGVSINGGTIYITHYPCLDCAKMIIATGLRRVVYLHDKNLETPSVMVGTQLFQDCNLQIKKLS